MTRLAPSVLLAEGESREAESRAAFLETQGFATIWVRDRDAAIRALEAEPFEAMVADLDDPAVAGVEVVGRALEIDPRACVLGIVRPETETAGLVALARGAWDYQLRPVRPERLLAALRRGIQQRALARRVAELEERLDERLSLDRLGGRSRAIQRIMEMVRRIAGGRAHVLVEGEIGTGKRLLAQTIHRHGPLRDGPFASLELSTIPADALEAELFGREDTSPIQRGALELAHGGTLFLDEVGELPIGIQARLLDYLVNRSFERVGGSETQRSEARIIVSSTRDLVAEVAAGRFREDLFVRLGGIRIAMPPLRERADDVPTLVETFLRDFNRQYRRGVTGITPGVLERFMRYPWPGNVRELKNTMAGMVAFAEGARALQISDLPPALREGAPGARSVPVAVGTTVEEAERLLVAATLEHTGQDKRRAAAMLGIGLRTLYRKIERYALR